MKKALVLLVSACILNACTEDEFYTNKKATNSEQSFYEFAAFNDSLKNTPHRAETSTLEDGGQLETRNSSSRS